MLRNHHLTTWTALIVVILMLFGCVLTGFLTGCSPQGGASQDPGQQSSAGADGADPADTDDPADGGSGTGGAIPIKVLILPKFEVDKISGDFPGEAQLYYEKYCEGGEEYELERTADGAKLYVKDGVALCTVGMGKVSAAINTAAVLSDERFDFSDAYIVSVGCGGSAEGYGRLGDVYIVSASCDFDFGHHADPREMEDDSRETWFHDSSYDSQAVVRMNRKLTEKVYDLVKDTELETTEISDRAMKKMFPGEKWAERKPKVLMGTTVTSDNYWKGEFSHRNALLITETYGCEDPYALSEMEDMAVAQAVKSCGMLDRLINIRVSVNMDVFLSGSTPEKLWGEAAGDSVAAEVSEEALDIFAPAMRNNIAVGGAVIDAILQGKM